MFKITFPATIIGIVMFLSTICFVVYGYINNIVKIVGMFGQDLNTIAVELIIRLIGVVVGPLGVVAGYF